MADQPISVRSIVAGGLFALFITFLIAAPELAGVTGIAWAHLAVAGAVLAGILLIFTDLFPKHPLHHKLLWLLLLLVVIGTYDYLIVRAKKSAAATQTEGKDGATAPRFGPGPSTPSEGGVTPPHPSTPPPNSSVVGTWEGGMSCRYHSDRLTWTITPGKGDTYHVNETWHTAVLGFGPREPVPYTATWSGDLFRLTVQPGFGTYHIDLHQSKDGNTLEGFYKNHGSCDKVSMERQ